jgi:hypothetical protein
MLKDKKKTVKELNAELELLAERVKKLEVKDASKDPDKVQEKLNGIEEILKSYDKKIGDLDRELLQARHNNNIEKGMDSKRIDGKVCDKTAKGKPLVRIISSSALMLTLRNQRQNASTSPSRN